MKTIEELAQPCLGCPKPLCAANCPCGNAIPSILSAVKAGDLALAAKRLYATNPFPELTSRLCDHARQCRGHCIRGIKGEPVDFPAVEALLAESLPFPYVAGKPNGKTVCIIGAGPAGLSAATFLIEAGFAVDIYEKEASLGGAILTGIPGFRLDKSLLSKIQNSLVSLGVTFHFNMMISSEGLRGLMLSHDYVLLATGATKENQLDHPRSQDIRHALPVLHALNVDHDDLGLSQKEHIVVMGGGNVAMDVSRSLRRLGPKVTLIYRRDENSMPAQKKEIAEAKEDGVVFVPLTNVASYGMDEGRLCYLNVVNMCLGEPDASGRPSFAPIEGSEHRLDCDAFVMAIGEKSDLTAWLGDIALSDRLVAIGDCSYGPKNIASAIKSGREAAQRIIAEVSLPLP